MVNRGSENSEDPNRSSPATGAGDDSGSGTGNAGGGAILSDGVEFTRTVFDPQSDPNKQVFYYLDQQISQLKFGFQKSSNVDTKYVRLVSTESSTAHFSDFDNVTVSDQNHAIWFEGDSAVIVNVKNSTLNKNIGESTDSLWALKMGWEMEGAWNESTSPYFAFANVPSKATELQNEINSAPGGQNGTVGDIKPGGSGGGPQGTSAASPPGSSGTDASSNNSSHKSGGGLAPGAIAGIVVGAVVGLAAIALLAWFLLRRKRQSKAVSHTGPEDGPDDSNAYIADKDSQAQSPQSPYADDHSQLHSQEHNQTRSGPDATGTAAAAATTTSTDRGIPSASSEHIAGDPGYRNASGAQTPQGVSHNVVHLVEEGMTADDIARLEEEERQLDAEIERAGQH